MRFTFISSMSGGPWGGSEELWSQAALRLRKEGHQVSACMPRWPQPSPKFLALGKEGIQLHTQPRYLHVSVRAWHKLKRRLGQPKEESVWMKQQKPDLAIISQGGNGDGLSWMEISRDLHIPFVAIVQANTEIAWPADDWWERLAAVYCSARRVFCVSRGNLKMLENQIAEPLPNATVVWNPYNVPADQPLGWPAAVNGIWRMACVARLEPAAKGQDLLLQILSHSPWTERPLELHLYGSGNFERNLQRLAEKFQLKNVHFHGHVKDVRRIWEQNHILVLSSRWEGLPLALVEAMWCERPAIVTDVAGNTEVCVDGETGFVAAAPAAKLLEEALERAWNCRSDWQRMGMAARARAEKLIPKDPVGDFCRQLQEVANAEEKRAIGVA
ncbi:MAG: glycosyltransferase family 4 protein [Acidobacteriia bacterium]|nr:glycosyltransferase family 4 protein [Terriglobia bacterium]